MSDVFRAIADPTRRQILDILRTIGELRAGDIADHFPDITRIAVSKHLRILREAHLVRLTESEDARERTYAIDGRGLFEMTEWLRPYETFWQEKLDVLKQMIENEGANDTSIDENGG